MTAQIISGTQLSQQIREDVTKRAAALTAQGKQPGLAVIWWATILLPKSMCAIR